MKIKLVKNRKPNKIIWPKTTQFKLMMLIYMSNDYTDFGYLMNNFK